MFHFRIVLILSTFIGLFDGVFSQSKLHSGRGQLMRDALGWMTLRNNGVLLSDAELEKAFLTHVTDKYRNNSFYRTFVIGFMEAVVPRLTLNENEPCDPAYTLKYKDSLNSSVTYGYQRLFTFDIYDNRKRNRDRYCDYRQGLICHPTARKCACPEGSTMQPIDRSSSVKRCLLQENEICSLLDLSHEKDYSILKDNLHHLIFNLEKPPGCKMGTQCRFRQSDLTTPHCYDAKSGPWAPPYTDSAGNTANEWRINFGEECTLGLYANSGSCITLPRQQTIGGVIHGYTCYNYGPPRSTSGSGRNNRTGFCANHFGPYGITNSMNTGNNHKSFEVFFSPYIHPRTVPLRGQELEHLYLKFLDATDKTDKVHARWEGESCSISKTKEYEDLWKYFMGLAKNPPPGQDYVPEATKSQLELNLQKFEDLSDLTVWPGSMCKVYDEFHRSFGSEPQPLRLYPSLKCVKNGTSDGKGNDGKCRPPGSLAKETIPEARRFQRYFEVDAELENLLNENFNEYPFDWALRKDILRGFPEHIDKQCSEQSPVCPANRTCFDDYSDDRDMYDSGTCEFKKLTQELDVYCHRIGPNLKYGRCEEEHLNRRAFEEFERMGEYSILGLGDSCDHELQKSTRQWIKDGRAPDGINRYVFLAKLKDVEKSVKEGRGGGICDFSRLQACGTKNHVCRCLTINSVRFVPRNVTVAGVDYQSDYCYQPSGECGVNIDEIDSLTLTKSEKKKFRQHYGNGNKCDGENVCVYFDEKTGTCTDENTGNTGYEAPKVEPSSVKPGSEDSGYGFAGGCEYFGGNKMLKGLILAFGLSAFILREI